MKSGHVVSVLCCSLLVACAARKSAPDAEPRRVMPEGATAPLFNDLGDHGYAVSTSSKQAQRYFDQGLILSYGFNHAEAARSYQEAQRLDPNCAMCFWGEAYVLGANINKPMEPSDAPRAHEAAEQGLRVAKAHGTTKEQALLAALTTRYTGDPKEDRATLDAAYANAMRTVAKNHPDDVDIQTFFAESLMDTMPWDYYASDGAPKPATTETIATLERVMTSAPSHPGATHLYIHIVEAEDPQKAEVAADQLRGTVPGAGHLVHMPSHIYLRVGRYNDAAVVNQEAAEADESYISQCLAQGFYPALYYPHNVHFLWSAATFQGRSAFALETAKKMRGFMPDSNVREFPFLEEFMPIVLQTQLRFGQWNDVLATPAFAPDFRYANANRHYARGIALATSGDIQGAKREQAQLDAIATGDDMKQLAMVSVGSSGADLLAVAAAILDGEIASAEGDHARAIAALTRAAKLQDELTYTEPPPWYLPVRDALGRAQLRAGKPADAERSYREQLKHTPRSGWTLFGLAQSLRAQGKTAQAEVVDQQARESWARADTALSASVF